MKDRVHLTMDGRELEADTGATILEVARQNGIHIPTLCYSELLKPLESCRICVVKVDGEPKFLSACSTVVRDGMVITTNSREIQETRKLLIQLLLQEHYGDCVAPCQLTCPAGIDIQGYIALISQGQYLEAVKLIRERLPMPLTIGRVCPHFCESQCRRNLVEEPININHLKRFVADYEMHLGTRCFPAKEPPTGRRVAIIGGGPAGLAAAYYLCLQGHSPAIFEAMPQLGGMLRYGIPEYRLPKKVLDWEIEGILGLGVEVKTGVRWGRDFTLDSLKREGFEAFFVAIGAWATRKLGVSGEELIGVIPGVDFLADVALGKSVTMGRRVAIIGGGNVAMDAARTGVRLGVEEITVIYRRSRDEMPASHEEIEGAMAEGIKFHFLAAPVRLFGANGKVQKLEYVRMRLGEPDASGRRRPIPEEGSETVIPVDMVIAAIGQFSDLSPLENDKAVAGMPVTRWNTIGADPESMSTGMEGIFTGGDAYRGPDTVVRALADGRRAAMAIHRYLVEEKVAPLPKAFNILKGDLKAIDREPYAPIGQEARARMPELEPGERITNFDQIDLGLPDETARREAERCLSCGCMDVFDCRLRRLAFELGALTTTRLEPRIPFAVAARADQHEFIALDPNKCVRCKQCYEACTFSQCSDAIDFAETPTFNSRCVFCGLCLDVCPTGALDERIASGKPGPIEYRHLETTCAHCGCGCTIVLNLKDDKLYTVTASKTAPPSYGHTCRRGRFDSFAHLNGEGRLRVPLVRRNGALVESTWDEALDLVGREFRRLQREQGVEALAALGSPRATNEANYLLQKLFRGPFRTNNLDFPGSQPYLTGMSVLSGSLGFGAMTNAIAEIEKAEVILAVGNLIEETNPIVATALRRASRTHGRHLITLTSAAVPLGAFAKPALVVAHGGEAEVLSTIIQRILRLDLYNREFTATRARGLDGLMTLVSAIDPRQAAAALGISRETLEGVAGACAGASSLAVVYSEDAAGDPRIVEGIVDLAILTGRVGRERSGIYPLCRHINTQGALDMGMAPILYPGHEAVTDEAARARLGRAWGMEPPARPGLSYWQMIEAARQGTLRGLYLLGENLLAQESKWDQVREGLSRLEFLVTQEMFLSQTAELAHVVLPAASFLEQEGTFTNTERRVELLRAAVTGPEGARPDWQIVADLLTRVDSGTTYSDAASVFQEIAAVVPFYEGLSHARLQDGGIPWPCRTGGTDRCDGLATLEMMKKHLEFALPS
jgi:formate dehydrogenase major subunit